jgi:serine/threonine protein kinase
MSELSVSLIVSLAKAGYDSCRAVKENEEQAAIIAERLTWIMRRTEKWRHLCDVSSSSSSSTDTFARLYKALEDVNLVMEAASKERESWRSRIKKFIGAKDLTRAIEQAEQQLNNVLQDIGVDETSSMKELINEGFKNMMELLESFGSRQSSIEPSKTNQEELNEALDTTLKGTSEIVLSDPISSSSGDVDNAIVDDDIRRVQFHLTEANARSLEINLDELEYDEAELLGEGSFSKVFAGTYRKEPVAVKQVKIDARELQNLSTEQVLRDAKHIAAEALFGHRCSLHPNIVQIHGFHANLLKKRTDISMMERPLIVMERMHVSLYDMLHYQCKVKPLSFSKRLAFLHDIARALEFLHLQGIVHHDVKTQNIMLNKDLTEAKLSDFGEAKVKGLNTTRLRLPTILSTAGPRQNVTGTVAYQAPELLAMVVKTSSRVSEMYSFGVTVWECMTGAIPHEGMRENALTILAQSEDLPMLALPDTPPRHVISSDYKSWEKMREVASKCLSRDRSARLTASQVVRTWNCPAIHSLGPTAATSENPAPLTTPGPQIPHARLGKKSAYPIIPEGSEKDGEFNLYQRGNLPRPSHIISTKSSTSTTSSSGLPNTRHADFEATNPCGPITTLPSVPNVSENDERSQVASPAKAETENVCKLIPNKRWKCILLALVAVAIVVSVAIGIAKKLENEESSGSENNEETEVPTGVGSGGSENNEETEAPTGVGSGGSENNRSDAPTKELSATLEPSDPLTQRQRMFLNALRAADPPISESPFFDPQSAQYQALDFLASTDGLNLDPEAVDLPELLDRFVLSVLYYSTDGENWDNQLEFLQPINSCEWHGVAENLISQVPGAFCSSVQVGKIVLGKMFFGS